MVDSKPSVHISPLDCYHELVHFFPMVVSTAVDTLSKCGLLFPFDSLWVYVCNRSRGTLAFDVCLRLYGSLFSFDCLLFIGTLCLDGYLLFLGTLFGSGCLRLLVSLIIPCLYYAFWFTHNSWLSSYFWFT